MNRWHHNNDVIIKKILCIFKIKFPTKHLFRIFPILRINGMAPFCNLFIEQPSYVGSYWFVVGFSSCYATFVAAAAAAGGSCTVYWMSATKNKTLTSSRVHHTYDGGFINRRKTFVTNCWRYWSTAAWLHDNETDVIHAWRAIAGRRTCLVLLLIFLGVGVSVHVRSTPDWLGRLRAGAGIALPKTTSIVMRLLTTVIAMHRCDVNGSYI